MENRRLLLTNLPPEVIHCTASMRKAPQINIVVLHMLC